MCRLACKVYSATLSPTNIQSAFKRCGIYPFNPLVISDIQVAPSTTFSKGDEAECNLPPAHVEQEAFLQEKGGKILANVEKAKITRNTLNKVFGEIKKHK